MKLPPQLEHLGEQVARGCATRREFLERAAAMGLSGVIGTSLLNTAIARAGPQKGGTLSLAVTGASTTDSLDPALLLDWNHCRAWGETLTETHPSGVSVLPGLAESFEPADGGSSWIFKLRRGIQFHNGKTLTAADAVQTVQRHSDPRQSSGALGLTRSIAEVRADGRDVVRIRLKEPNLDFPYVMADAHFIIQPDGGMTDPAAGISTGPYRIEHFEPGVRFFATKFPGYWRNDVGHASAVEILMINDAAARVSALHSGRVHLISKIEPRTVRLLQRLPRIVIENTAGRAHYFFALRCDSTPYDNVELRLALKYAIDREEMVKRVLHGFGSVGNDHPINAAYPLFNGQLEQRTYDPDRAAHHYRRSGHSGVIVMTTSETAFPAAIDAAVLFQQHAARCGIKLQINRAPSDGYWSSVWNVNPFAASISGGRPVQDLMFSSAYRSDSSWNETAWHRPRFDELSKRARAEPDSARRTSLYSEMTAMIRNDGGAIIPMFAEYIDARSDRVGGYVRDPGYQLSNGFAAIRCWLT